MDGISALVIDDEVHFRYFLRVLLEKAGFAVKMARNGIEALDVPVEAGRHAGRHDAGAKGRPLYGAVCRDEDWKRIPVVMLSAVPISVREHAFANRPDAGPASRPPRPALKTVYAGSPA